MASNKRVNKAYVRYDGNGRVIAGSLILNRFKPKVGNWQEIPAYECCNPVSELPLRMLFSNILEVDAIVGDSSNVADWNTYFDLPTLGTPFTSVSVVGNEVKLYGGSGIKAKPALMYGGYGNDNFIIELDDQAGCITSVGGDAFSYQYALTLVNLPECTIVYGVSDSPESDEGGFGYCTALVSVNIPKLATVEFAGFEYCNALESINFPLLTDIGNSAFGYCYPLTTINIPSCVNLGSTVTGSSVFIGVTGNTITLTVPSALMTNNGGLPDGDIQYLQANNTVTVITV